MYQILRKTSLNPTVTRMEIEAPLVAAKAKPGQFIILRVNDEGERIPLTVAGYDRQKGSVTIIFQVVGATTMLLNQKNEGEFLQDFVGPLGTPTELDGLKKVCVIGGGVGCAIALPIAEELHRRGAEVSAIIGFREKSLVILEEEFRQASKTVTLVTDDGSAGERGNVCMPLQRLLTEGERFERVIAIGPLRMMQFAVETLRPYAIPCTVSMNPIMIDGTGMCGGCRLTLRDGKGGKKTVFACVDGPDFDGYAVDFEEAISRSSLYLEAERKKREQVCRLLGKPA